MCQKLSQASFFLSDRALDCDLALFLGDYSQSEKNSEIKPHLDWGQRSFGHQIEPKRYKYHNEK